MSMLRLDDYRILIVDDLAEMRSTLKSMINRMGGTKIDVAMNGEDALSYLRNKEYALVLSDYELGRGKDGQQVLEETRHAKLLNAGAAFVLVTGAQTIEMVMGALEYHPDGYITKPVTFDEFHSRLQKIFRQKNHFALINQAIDKDNLPLALQECDILINNKPKLALSILRVKGKLLFDHGKYLEAKQIYESVLKARDVAWAVLGYSKCLVEFGEVDEAIERLNKVTQTNQRYVECYDLLAKIYEEKGDPVKGQEILMAAVEQSPKAILRQAHLAKLALINNDYDTAAKAAKKAAILSKNSCHSTPENYMNLCQALQEQVKHGGYRDKTYALNEIKKSLKVVRENDPENKELMIRTNIIEALTLNNQGKQEQASGIMLEAKDIFRSMDHPPKFKKTIYDVAFGLAECTDKENAIAFVDDIEEKKWLPPDEVNELREKVLVYAEQKADQISESYNNKAVSLFEKGKVVDAIDIFNLALKNPRAGYGVLLNAIQALITQMQRKGVKYEYKQRCAEYLDRAKNIPEDDERYARFEKLNNMFQEIIKDGRAK